MLVVSVCSLKGGVGKTSVVLGLASAARARGVPTLVVDLDPQGDATTGLDVEVNGSATVADVLAKPRANVVESAVVASGWTPDSPGELDVLVGSDLVAAHDVPAPTERQLARLADGLGQLNGTYQLVLVDCPPSLGGLTRTGLRASRRALVVTEPSLFAVSAADRALRAVEDLRQGPAPDLRPAGVVVNRVRARSVEHDFRVAELNELFGAQIVATLPERSVLQQAQGAGRPVHEWAAPAAKEVAASFDELLERVLRSGRAARRGRG